MRKPSGGENSSKASNSCYSSEKILAKEFCSTLESSKSPWGQVDIVREFNYIRGRTDVVAIDKDENVYAFELKLDKWSQALQQAYRNTCFAHGSYVVLPESKARYAYRYLHEFSRHSVGLCSIEKGTIVILVPATFQSPIQPWLSNSAISKCKEKGSNDSRG